MAIQTEFLPGSGSTNGRQIKITAVTSPGTLLHTSSSTSGVEDSLQVWYYNSSSSSVAVTVEWGGTSADDRRTYTIPPYDNVAPDPILPIDGGLAVRAYASSANVVFASTCLYRRSSV